MLYKKYGDVRIYGYSDSDYAGDKGIENLPLDIAHLLKKSYDLEE